MRNFSQTIIIIKAKHSNGCELHHHLAIGDYFCFLVFTLNIDRCRVMTDAVIINFYLTPTRFFSSFWVLLSVNKIEINKFIYFLPPFIPFVVAYLQRIFWFEFCWEKNTNSIQHIEFDDRKLLKDKQKRQHTLVAHPICGEFWFVKDLSEKNKTEIY